MTIAHWNGTSWEDKGNGGYTGGISGTITTLVPVSSFSPFTLASTDLLATPPPLQLLAFHKNIEGHEVVIRWEMATDRHVQYYELERSGDGINFTPLSML